jgi:ubiquinone/menaquinone biosynthesis C-methylase UbiE
MNPETEYSNEPEDKKAFTYSYDHLYSKFAWVYDLAVRASPFWKRWLSTTLPHIRGPRVLEVSFGTGFLLTQYANKFVTCGLDYNRVMATLASKKARQEGLSVHLQQGNVEALPYRSESFDSLINTMAFTGYPDGLQALSEMSRVLKIGGRLIMVDINYPLDRNLLGVRLTNFWKSAGDIIRDMPELFRQFGFSFSEQVVGGWGSVHLYVAIKQSQIYAP